MEEFDLTKSFDELLKPSYPPEGAALKNTTEAPKPIEFLLAEVNRQAHQAALAARARTHVTPHATCCRQQRVAHR
jgi:hypothetical protein